MELIITGWLYVCQRAGYRSAERLRKEMRLWGLRLGYALAQALRQAAGGIPTMRLNARENAASDS